MIIPFHFSVKSPKGKRSWKDTMKCCKQRHACAVKSELLKFDYSRAVSWCWPKDTWALGTRLRALELVSVALCGLVSQELWWGHEWLATLSEYNRTNNRNNATSPNTITAATMIKTKAAYDSCYTILTQSANNGFTFFVSFPSSSINSSFTH